MAIGKALDMAQKMYDKFKVKNDAEVQRKAAAGEPLTNPNNKSNVNLYNAYKAKTNQPGTTGMSATATTTPPTAPTTMTREQIMAKMYDRLNAAPTQFSYDPNTDPQYQAALRAAQANAQTASNANMAEMNRRGILNSDITSNNGERIKQEYMADVANNALPQMMQQAYQRYLGDQAQQQQQFDNAMNVLGYGDSYDQQQWQNRFNYGNAIGQFSNGQKTMAQKQFDRGITESDRNYNYQVGRDKVADQRYDKEFAYQQSRDQVADQRWQQEFDRTGQQFAQQMGIDWSKLSQAQQQFAVEMAYRQQGLSLDQAKFAFEQQQASMPKATSYQDVIKDIDSSQYVAPEIDEDGVKTGKTRVTDKDALEEYILNIPGLTDEQLRQLYARYGLPLPEKGR